MARRRFFVDRIDGDRAVLNRDDAAHLARVLRAEVGQQYEISYNSALYLAEISEVGRDRVAFRVVRQLDFPAPPVRVILCAALIKFDRFEWLVEKATELGVEAILPVAAARSESGLFEAAAKRVERWRRIAREASQQSRRMRIPEIRPPVRLAECAAAEGSRRYYLEEIPGAPPILSALPSVSARAPTDEVKLLVGPEGGWTGEERPRLLAQGWTAVSVAPGILRAETAALAAVAVLINVWMVPHRTAVPESTPQAQLE